VLRASLLQLANRRLILVGLLAIILSSAFALLAWRYTLDAHAVRVAEQTRQHYDAKVAEHRKAWHRAAQRLKAQIEFLRIGELPPEQRRNRLIAFFNAQGENREFAGILIGNSGGLPLYSLGCHQMLMESLNVMQMASLAMEDVFMRGQCTGGGQVYSVTHATLWMGVEGKGLALFATALDNAYLARLARGQDTVRLVIGGRVMAASNGSEGLSGHAVSSGGNTLLPNGILRIRLPLDATEPETGPLLVIEHPTNPLLSTPMILLGVTLTSLLFFALVWFGLGRAIRAHLGDLVAISRGAAEFRRDYKRGTGLVRGRAGATRARRRTRPAGGHSRPAHGNRGTPRPGAGLPSPDPGHAGGGGGRAGHVRAHQPYQQRLGQGGRLRHRRSGQGIGGFPGPGGRSRPRQPDRRPEPGGTSFRPRRACAWSGGLRMSAGWNSAWPSRRATKACAACCATSPRATCRNAASATWRCMTP
jgi:hypothetical protein